MDAILLGVLVAGYAGIAVLGSRNLWRERHRGTSPAPSAATGQSTSPRW